MAPTPRDRTGRQRSTSVAIAFVLVSIGVGFATFCVSSVYISNIATVDLTDTTYVSPISDIRDFLYPTQEDFSKTAWKIQSNNSPKERVRYDVAASRMMERSPGIIHALPSIPKKRRYPEEMISNRTFFTASRLMDEDNAFLFEYNPVLFPIYSTSFRLSEKLLADITGRGSFSEDEANAVQYVGVFRISNHKNCYGPGIGFPMYYKNYLGLALLDSNLEVIPGTDVVVDINKYFFTKRADRQSYEDCQLIAASKDEASFDEKGQLFLFCNQYLAPITLRRVQDGNDFDDDSVPVMYGRGLAVKFLCKLFLAKTSGGRWSYRNEVRLQFDGKNMHIYESNRQTYLELYPSSPHVWRRINLVLPNDVKHYDPFPGADASDQWNERNVEPEPGPTFNSIEGTEFVFGNYTESRGTACCIRVQVVASNETKPSTALVGIGHDKPLVKDHWAYSYVSFFYAFEAEPPFKIISKSGRFCLGWPKEGDDGFENQVFAYARENMIKRKPNFVDLELQGVKFSCPRIHFPSGIVEKVGDPDTIIISYGVNDCLPRSMQVPKKEIMDLLFPPEGFNFN